MNDQVIGIVSSLGIIALIFVFIGIVQAYGADITTDVQGDFVQNTSSWNMTQNNLDAQTTISEKSDNVSSIIMVGAIIGVLVAALGGVFAFRQLS